AGPGGARELDAQRGDRRAGRHPHRPGEPADAGDLHAVRGASVGGSGRWPIPVPGSHRRGRHRHRHAPVRGAVARGAALLAASDGFVRAGAADRHRRCPGAGRRRDAGAGRSVRGGRVRQRVGHAPRPRSLVVPAVVGTAAGLVALLVTNGSWRAAVIGTFIAAVIGLSLVVVTGYAGQVSLAQLALAGAAAFTLSGLTQGWGVPFPFAPLLAALVATGVGMVVGLPALR